MSSKFMYDRDAMLRRLIKGDVGESLFRFWFDQHVGSLENVRLIHWGYNPYGIVEDEEKRKLLKQKSDPDFAIVSKEDEKRPIVGISVNSQGKPYDCHSTMGGGCIKIAPNELGGN